MYVGRKIKFLLLAVILLVIMGISALAISRKIKENPEEFIEQVSSQADSRMEDIHYTQTNEEGFKEWEFEATTVNYFGETNLTMFKDIRATFFSKDGKVFTLRGDRGKWYMISKNMEISGNILGTSSDGYEFRTSTLSYDSQKRKILSTERVKLTYQGFELEGKGMAVDIDEGKISLLNNVKAKVKR